MTLNMDLRRSKLEKIDFTGNFSFVNKTSVNIEHKDHRATVAWHLAHRYAQFRKQEVVRPSIKRPGWIRTNSSPNAQALSVLEHPAPKAPAQQTAISASNPPEHRVDLHFPSEQIQWNDVVQEEGPVTTSSARRSDDGHRRRQSRVLDFVSDLISLARDILIPTLWPQLSNRPIWRYQISCAHQDLDNIKDDSLYSNASFAFLATICLALVQDEKMVLYADYYQRKALSKLAGCVNAPNQSDLSGVLRLFSTATVLDDISSAHAHLKTMYTMAELCGGLRAVDPWLCQNIVAADTYFALKNGTRPMFQRCTWAPELLIMPWARKDHTEAGRQKRTQCISSAIEHNALRVLVVDLQELFDLEQFLNERDDSFNATLARWSYLRRIDCLSRLADHRVDLSLFHHLHPRPKFHFAVTTTLLLLASMVFGMPESVGTGLRLISELKAYIEEAEDESSSQAQSDHKRDRQLSFCWIVHTGILATQVHPVEGATEWFHTRFASFSTAQGVPQLGDLRHGREKHLYSKALEDEIQRGRPFRRFDTLSGFYELCGMSWREPFADVTASTSLDN